MVELLRNKYFFIYTEKIIVFMVFSNNLKKSLIKQININQIN